MIYYLFPYHQEEWKIFKNKMSLNTWDNNENSILIQSHQVHTKDLSK